MHSDVLDSLLDVSPDPALVQSVRELSQRDAIRSIVLAKRMRATHVDRAQRAAIVEYLDRVVSRGEPLLIVNSWGGFKAHRVRSAPHLEWSEVFHLHFFCRWLASLAEVYPLGVRLEYSGQGPVATLVDNYRREDVQCYGEEMSRLAAIFDERTPRGVSIVTRDLDEFYERDDLCAILDSAAAELPGPAGDETWLRHARNNFCRDGERDLRSISGEQLDEELRRSVQRLRAWYAYDADARRDYFGAALGVSNGAASSLYRLSSVAGSDRCFWMTEGVLVAKGEQARTEIVMPDDTRLAAAIEIELQTKVSRVSPGLERIRVVAAEPAS